MNLRTLLLFLALCFVGATPCLGQAANLGTWKLNESKSHIAPGTMKVNSMVISSDGETITITQDGVDQSGKPIHTEWTGKLDGKDYPVTGSPAFDSRSYTVVDEHTLVAETKKDGKVVVSARNVVSEDGKTRTVEVTQTDSSGNKVTSTAVFDKE